MPLVNCPDCGRRHSDAAAACPECARPNMAVAVIDRAAIPVVPIAPGPKSELACPSCGSENTRRLSMVFKEGISTLNTVTHAHSAGVAAGGAGIGAGVAHTSAQTAGRMQTALSAEAAPPRPQNGIVFIVFGAILVLLSIVIWSGLSIPFGVGGLAMIAAGIPRHRWDREELPRLREIWEESYQCLRCGTRFRPSPPRA